MSAFSLRFSSAGWVTAVGDPSCCFELTFSAINSLTIVSICSLEGGCGPAETTGAPSQAKLDLSFWF